MKFLEYVKLREEAEVIRKFRDAFDKIPLSVLEFAKRNNIQIQAKSLDDSDTVQVDAKVGSNDYQTDEFHVHDVLMEEKMIRWLKSLMRHGYSGSGFGAMHHPAQKDMTRGQGFMNDPLHSGDWSSKILNYGLKPKT